MARFLLHESNRQAGRFRVLLLAAAWFLGLLAGAYLFSSADQSSASLMRAAVSGRVSIVGSLVVTLLPFLFSAFAVYVSRPALLLPIAFGKGVSVSLVSLGIGAALGGAAWLIRGLVMFSDLAVTPLLVFYWLRHISGRRFSIGPCLAFLGAAWVVCCIDLRFISPILAGI